MAILYLSTGSNEGDKLNLLLDAALKIEHMIGRVIICSSVYETSPWGFESANRFFNQVIKIDTALTAEEVLKCIHAIETGSGRVRSQTGYSDRRLDVDILFYGKQKINNEVLTIPHPHMHLRRFVLEPLSEIAAGLIHPVAHRRIKTLLGNLKSGDDVEMVMPAPDFMNLMMLSHQK